MSFIVISDPVCFEEEADLINQLFEQGMPVFHLRKPDGDIASYGRLLSSIVPSYHDRIALHQFHELVKDFPLISRLHYPESFREKACKYSGKYRLSTSIHSLNKLEELNDFDYTFYGPVFDSISKPGYAGLNVAALEIPQAVNRTKLIALGGISIEKVHSLKLMGFDGMAVLGSIWNDKKQAVASFKSLINKYNESFS